MSPSRRPISELWSVLFLLVVLATLGESFLIHESCNTFGADRIEAATIEAIDMAGNAAKWVIVTEGRGNLFTTVLYKNVPVTEELDDKTRGVVRGKW